MKPLVRDLPDQYDSPFSWAVQRIAVTGKRILAASHRNTERTAVAGPAAGAGLTGSPRSLTVRAAQGRDEAQATVRRITGEMSDLDTKAADCVEVAGPRLLLTGCCDGESKEAKVRRVLDAAA